ncbi:MAG: hypothetical protein K8L97_18065 [Anaerolineae bacterium]|nr:hypothetical protein [Anaerolineae bacterium]
MNSTPPAPARLFGLLAREASIGVIIRRGQPKNWIQLIHWDTQKDVFKPGQWFHGRVYDERSDLSPDGKLWVYFAAKYTPQPHRKQSYHHWTAVSKPPYFTALYFQPEVDTYSGGGSFINNNTILYNSVSPSAGAQSIPDTHLTMTWGDIHFLPASFYKNLEIHGWVSADQDACVTTDNSPIVQGKTPSVWQKQSGKYQLSLKYTRKGRVYSLRISGSDFGIPSSVNWADFDQRGRLVLAREGKLFSASLKNDELIYHELADFNNHRPERMEAPDWAKKW